MLQWPWFECGCVPSSVEVEPTRSLWIGALLFGISNHKDAHVALLECACVASSVVIEYALGLWSGVFIFENSQSCRGSCGLGLNVFFLF